MLRRRRLAQLIDGNDAHHILGGRQQGRYLWGRRKGGMKGGRCVVGGGKERGRGCEILGREREE